jgi:hypothetical protein
MRLQTHAAASTAARTAIGRAARPMPVRLLKAEESRAEAGPGASARHPLRVRARPRERQTAAGA